MTSNPVDTAKSRAEFDRDIIAHADYFTACKFLGRARYETIKVDSLEKAREAAQEMVGRYGGIVMIYAVYRGFTAHVENFPLSKPSQR